MTNNEKLTGSTRNNMKEDFEEEFDKGANKTRVAEYFEFDIAEHDKKKNSSSGSSGSSRNGGSGSPNYRNKYKELKEAELREIVKKRLSEDTQATIDLENEELDKIIEKLKCGNVGRDKGQEMQRFRTISRGRFLSK